MSKEEDRSSDNNSLTGANMPFINEDGTNTLEGGGVDLDDLFQDYYFGQDDHGGHAFNPATGAAMPQGPTDMMEYHGMKSVPAVPATAKDLRKRKSNPSTYATDIGSNKRGGGSSGGDKPLTDAQKVERRERNREHAKRSRLRKKFLLESLQEQINGLQSENENLKEIIRKENFAISDPSLPDNPIVYVSQGFLDLTGYKLDQVLGRNCRFLQGPGTDQSAVDVIRKGLREGVDTSVCLLNYKADGTPFWNQFFVAALRDAEGNVVNFVGVQCEVSKATVESQLTGR
ncbi:hypothetical protein TrRE_jg11126 [Triparma retinervis]|uniref:LOV domain-containing protein n=1 Tax=Triparma retinervis TaxID=2557542 RepID=A0A9W7ANM3_9STRA|nr:hypothetical protein TrRE_jg11126 [Triparma retinervis]